MDNGAPYANAALERCCAVLGIRLIYAALPCALWLIAMAVLTRFDLTEAKFNALKAELLAKRAAAAAVP